LVAKVTKVFIAKTRAQKLSNYKSQASITGATEVLELISKMKIQKEKERRRLWCYHYTLPCCTHWKQPKAYKPIHHNLSRTTKTLNPTHFFTQSFSLCDFHNFAF
jgi:hypothetical protein